MWLTVACKIAQHRKKVILFRNKTVKNVMEHSVFRKKNDKHATHSRKNTQTAGGVSDTSDGLKQRQRDKGRKFFIRKVWWAGVAPMKKFLARCPGKKARSCPRRRVTAYGQQHRRRQRQAGRQAPQGDAVAYLLDEPPQHRGRDQR